MIIQIGNRIWMFRVSIVNTFDKNCLWLFIIGINVIIYYCDYTYEYPLLSTFELNRS